MSSGVSSRPIPALKGLTWVELVGFVPVFGVVVNRPHVDQNTRTAKDAVTSDAVREDDKSVSFHPSHQSVPQLCLLTGLKVASG